MKMPEKQYKREIEICINPFIYCMMMPENVDIKDGSFRELSEAVDGYFSDVLPSYERIPSENPFYFHYGTDDIHAMRDHVEFRELLTNDALGLKPSICSFNIIDMDTGEIHDFLSEQRSGYQESLNILKEKSIDGTEADKSAYMDAYRFDKDHPFMDEKTADDTMEAIDYR